jgi:hypothetical protein
LMTLQQLQISWLVHVLFRSYSTIVITSFKSQHLDFRPQSVYIHKSLFTSPNEQLGPLFPRIIKWLILVIDVSCVYFEVWTKF